MVLPLTQVIVVALGDTAGAGVGTTGALATGCAVGAGATACSTFG